MTGEVFGRWYLLQTKSREELRAIENLERQGVISFCPQISVEKISRGKRVIVDEVLFPGYLFVNFDHEKISAMTIRSTRGVLQFVSCAGSPVKVPVSLIEASNSGSHTSLMRWSQIYLMQATDWRFSMVHFGVSRQFFLSQTATVVPLS